MPDGVRHLSTTLINGWLDCPNRAWRSYMRRLDMGDDNEGTDATRFGTAVHNTLEYFHNKDMQGGVFNEINVWNYFSDQFALTGCLNPELYTLAKDKLIEFLARSLNERAGHTIATELLFVWDVEDNEVAVITIDGLSVSSYVQKILDKGHTPIVSKIDRVDRVDLPDGKYRIEVYDYKTNILPFTREYVENSKQLGIYDAIAHVLWPDAVDVTCIFDMVRHGRFPVTFDAEKRELLRSYLRMLWRQIEATEVPEERLNKYCRWCEIRSTCSAYQAILTLDKPPVATEQTTRQDGIDAMYEEMERLTDLSKIVDARLDEIKAALGAIIVKDNLGQPVQTGSREIYLLPNSRSAVDAAGVVEVFRKHNAITLLPSVISVQKTAIDRLIKQRPEFKDELTALIRKTFVSPSIKSRSLIGGKSKDAEESD